MKFQKAVPILYATDVAKSIVYFAEGLKLEHSWEWDSPPTFGGVLRDDTEIFFCKGDQGSPGTWLSIMVENVDDYYDAIKDSDEKNSFYTRYEAMEHAGDVVGMPRRAHHPFRAQCRLRLGLKLSV